MPVASLCGPIGRHSTNTINAALGVVFIHESVVTPWEGPVFLDVFFSYNFVALSLNVLLTLMIIVRIMLHRRNIINAMGTSAGVSGLYTTVITMLVESCAPYTIAYLLYLVPMATGSDITFVFTLVLGSLQVRTVFALPLGHRYIEPRLTTMVYRSLLPISSF